MNTRRCFYLVVALACILSLAAVRDAGAASSKEVIVLKFADPSPHGTTRTLSVVKWGEELEKRSNGRLKFEWYWSQSLAKALDTLNAVAGGIADAGMNAIMGYQVSQLPIWQLPELPMLCGSDMRAHGKVRKEMYFTIPEMKKEYDSLRVHPMVFGAYEPTVLYGKKPLRKLEDIKGLRIGVKGDLAKFVAAAGGVPVSLTSYEYYEGLQKGTIDAAAGYVTQMMSLKIPEVVKHLNLSPLQSYCHQYIINPGVYNKLPADLKKVIDDGWDLYLKIEADAMDRDRERDIRTMQEKYGIEISTPSPEEFARWEKLTLPIKKGWVEKIEKRGVDGQRFLDTYEQLYKKNAK